MIVYATTTGLTRWEGDTAEIDTAVRDLALKGVFAVYTRFTEPQGSGSQVTLWKKKGKGESLRIDFQRIFSTGEAKVTKSTSYMLNKKTYATYEAAKSVAKKSEIAKITEKETQTTTWDTDKLWSLFAVQEEGSYNQVFVLNNPSFNPGADEWVNYFQNTLRNECAAMITTARGNLPNGFSEHDLIAGVGDIPAD